MMLAGVRVVTLLDKVGEHVEEDGSVLDDKRAENERRNAKRDRMWESWLSLDWANMSDFERKENEGLKNKYLQGALRITPKLVWALTRGLRKEGVSYIMCPGEADHQMVHLVRSGLCQHALTIDGDVLAQGIPAIRKFDFQSGKGAVYQVPESPEFPLQGRGSFVWAFLLGCDYTNGVHGIGPKLAKEVLHLCKGSYDSHTVADAIIEVLPKAPPL